MYIIQTGVNPSGIAITKDNKYAYIANNNNYGIDNQDSVSVIDLREKKPIKIIYDKSFAQPYTITIDKTYLKAYVTNSNGSTISIIDTQKNIVSGEISGFDGPSGMVIKSDNITAYVNNYGGPDGLKSGNGNTISIVNLQTKQITGTINVDKAPAGVVLSKDENTLYCFNYVDGTEGSGTINVIDTSKNEITATIKGFFGPFGMIISPIKNFAYVTNFGSNNFNPIGTTVSVVDLKKNEIIKTINAGIQPSGIQFSKDGLFAFVSNYNTLYQDPKNFTGLLPGDGFINIIDTQKHEIINQIIPTGSSPSNIDITPNGKYLIVSNYSSNSISMIKIEKLLHELFCQ